MDSRFSLPRGTVLDRSYRIERVIGTGGFGVTYEAEDVTLGTKVALKEYYPEEFGARDDVGGSVRPKSERHKTTFEWGRKSFLDEARTLARFRHPSIVRITRVFEAHSTAYMVMEFEPGRSFESWLTHLNRAPTQDELDRIITPLLDALELMHAENFLHRDIAPDNIIIRADGTPVLLDFGAARRAVAEMSKALTGIVKAGYSPQEQYATDAHLQGPWTDIYALGATLYRAISGKPPEEATLRGIRDRVVPALQVAQSSYRPSFLSAIDGCLKVQPDERPQSVSLLRPMLLAPTARVTARVTGTGTRRVEATPPTRRVGQPPVRGMRWWVLVAAGIVLVIGAYGGYEYTRRSTETRDATTAATQILEAERAWRWVKDTKDTSVLQQFIKEFGGTPFGAVAKTRLEQLTPPATQLPKASPSPAIQAPKTSPASVDPPPCWRWQEAACKLDGACIWVKPVQREGYCREK